jgi:hypothetical protein
MRLSLRCVNRVSVQYLSFESEVVALLANFRKVVTLIEPTMGNTPFNRTFAAKH